MADNRLAEAVDILARHVVAYAVQNCTEDAWDFYDELGADDWTDIINRAEQLTPYPDQAAYQAAYDYLYEQVKGDL